MKKLLTIGLFLLTLSAYSQTKSVTLRTRANDPASNPTDSVIFDWIGKPDGYSSIYTGKYIKATFPKKDSVAQAIADILPGALPGQILLADSAGKFKSKNRIDTGNYVINAAELAAALALPTPTQGQIFATWQRFAHGGRSNAVGNQSLNDTIPSVPSMTQSWSFDAVTNVISSTFNSGASIGFISPFKYTDYTLKANLKSTDIDNDRIGAVLAYFNDETDLVPNKAYGLDPASYPGINTTSAFIPNQHTLTMYINRETGRPFYAIWYDYGKLSQKLILDGSASAGLQNLLTGWNNATTGVDIEVIRRGDSIFVSRTQFSDAVGGKGALAFPLAISLTQDPLLYKFRGGASYGFACNSQAAASFTIDFTGGSAGNVYDLANNVVYIPDGAGGYEVSPVTAKEAVEKGQMVYNPTTDRQFFKQDTFLEIKPTDKYALKTSVDSLKNSIYLNVKAPPFNAKGDGVTNDTQHIQAALDSAYNSGGGVVFMPQGSYVIKSDTATRDAIYIRDNVTLLGAGMGATVIFNDTLTKAVPSPGYVSGTNYALIRIGTDVGGANNVTVSNLTLNGNQSKINNGNTVGVPGYFGIITRYETADSLLAPLTRAAHSDNLKIQGVEILNTLWAIGSSRKVLSVVSVRDTIIKWNKNWLIENCILNGTFNRIMEFQFVDGLTIQNNKIFGAGHAHFLSGVKNLKFLYNYMRYGGDIYSHDYQHQGGIKQASGLYMNHSVANSLIMGNIIEDDPAIDPAITVSGAIRFTPEPAQAFPFDPVIGFRSSKNVYRARYTTSKKAITVDYSSSRILNLQKFSFEADTVVGKITLAPSSSSGLLTTLKDWNFTNVVMDTLEMPRTSYTTGSSNFVFQNSTINKDITVTTNGTKFITSKIAGLTIPSYVDSTEVNNTIPTTMTVSGTANNITFRNIPPLINNTVTNANYTVRYANQIINLPTGITANRTALLTSVASSLYKGQSFTVRNANVTAFSWLFSGSTVYLPNGTAITTIPNGSEITFVSNGDGTFLITNFSLTYGTGVATALGVATNATGGFVTSPVANANLANSSITLATPGTTGLAPNWTATPVSLGGTATLNIPNAATASVTGGLLSKTQYDALAAANGTVTNVTSANTDISVATGTTAPVLTLNSGALASQIVKRDANADIDLNGITAGRGIGSVANNVFYSAGLNSTSLGTSNIAFGRLNYTSDATGSSANTAVGSGVMRYLTTGANNTGVGLNTLNTLTSGTLNTAVGVTALNFLTTGANNVAFGVNAGRNIVTGSNNLIMGNGAGYNSTGSGNVFLGYNAGYNEVGDNKLYISNSNTATPLIKGDFTAGTLDITGRLSVQGSYLGLEGSSGQMSLRWSNGSDQFRILPPSLYSGSITQYTVPYDGTLLPYTGSFGSPNAGRTIMFNKTNGGLTLDVANVVNTTGYTVATLPTGTIGDMAYVTDALAPSYMVAVVGGGSVVTPVFYTGVAWVAH